MGMAEKIKERRLAMGYTQEELAQKLGLQKSAIAKYENGRVENIKRSIIQNMAKVLECSPTYLMNFEPNVEPAKIAEKGSVSIPVLGRVAAGIPIEAIEDIVDTEEIPKKLAQTGKFFGLIIKGDSMEPRMAEGDVVIVRQQDDAESGDIVIAAVNGTDATCKRIRKYRDGIELISINPAYAPMFFTNAEIEEKPIRILGKVVELRAKF